MSSEEPSLPENFLAPRDPQAIRALAHPVRMALIELLVHRGTLTATQASEALGESPANCAFHLRTLAKYGFIEEAGGGRGRERPWRRTHIGLSLDSASGSPEYMAALQALEDVALPMLLTRARATLAGRASWPAQWQGRLGESQTVTYLTPEEADELSAELQPLLLRYADRDDHPERRPPGAIPVEILTLAYPLLHLTDLPAADPGGQKEEG